MEAEEDKEVVKEAEEERKGGETSRLLGRQWEIRKGSRIKRSRKRRARRMR